MKFETRLRTLALLLALSGLFYLPKLHAQCGKSSDPQIIVGDACLQPGEDGAVLITAANFSDVHSWKIAICYHANPAYTVTGGDPMYPGVQMSWNPADNKFVFEMSSPGSCQGGGETYNPETVIAAIYVTANLGAQNGGTMFMNMCDISASEPSYLRICDGTNMVQAPLSDCVGGASRPKQEFSVAGVVRKKGGEGLPGVTISNSASATVSITGANGGYSLSNILINGLPSVTVLPVSGNININMNGITTFDVVPIKAHLNGPPTGTSLDCYQLVAADCDGNGVIEQADVDALEMALSPPVGPYAEVGKWVFIPEDYELDCVPFQLNVPTYPTSATYTGFCNDYYSGNFIAIHIGDVVDDEGFDQKTDHAARAAWHAGQAVMVKENPFRSEASFLLDLAGEAPATLRVFDGAGKLVHQSTHRLTDGEGTISVDATTWPAGMLMFQVSSGDERHAGRLIHLP